MFIEELEKQKNEIKEGIWKNNPRFTRWRLSDIESLLSEIEKLKTWAGEKIYEAYKLTAALEAERAKNAELREVCEWQQTDSDGNLWHCETCGAEWTFFEGSPFDNNMKYCPECGAKITAIVKKHFDWEADDYVYTTIPREAAAAALEKREP